MEILWKNEKLNEDVVEKRRLNEKFIAKTEN